jgi:hypothetical protein
MESIVPGEAMIAFSRRWRFVPIIEVDLSGVHFA